MRFDGREVAFGSPFDARAAGIEMIYQDLALCGDLDIAANVFLGRETQQQLGPFRLLDRVAMRDAARVVMRELGAELEPGRIGRRARPAASGSWLPSPARSSSSRA